jgi:hypothetical protein
LGRVVTIDFLGLGWGIKVVVLGEFPWDSGNCREVGSKFLNIGYSVENSKVFFIKLDGC